MNNINANEKINNHKLPILIENNLRKNDDIDVTNNIMIEFLNKFVVLEYKSVSKKSSNGDLYSVILYSFFELFLKVTKTDKIVSIKPKLVNDTVEISANILLIKMELGVVI